LENFKTLMVFTFPSEMVVVKSKLESEGIQCKVLDEHTVQVHNFLSQAIGGVRLQVAESNLEKARAILEENGLVDKQNEANKSRIEKIIDDTKFQKRLKFSLITGVVIILLLAIILLVY